MAVSPESMPEIPIDFRAPPPSPIASGRRSSVTNDEVLSEFLDSLRVPDLVLPDKFFPRQKIVETPPRIDFQSLNSSESDSVLKILDSTSRIGCFQLVNHGIPSDFIRLVLVTAAGIFRLSPERKAVAMRSPEKPYGFEEVHGDQEENESREEFVWCKDEILRLEMEGTWPAGYSNFSEKMESLSSGIANAAEKILLLLRENCPRKSMTASDTMMMQGQDLIGSVCCLYQHTSKIPGDRWASSLGYDVIRMLIKGTDYSHALCFHICDGASDFHVYSKKGWVSFCPDKDALVVTVGDQTQVWSGGRYKHVLGRPIFEGNEVEEDRISMAFLYSPASNTSSSTPHRKANTITVGQQAILAVILILVYNLLVCLYKKFDACFQD